MMGEKQILVMIKEPGKEPVVEPLFDNTLEAFQEAVGGHIESFTLTPELAIICNEEGKLKGLTYNVTVAGEHFVGTIIVVGVKSDVFTSVRAAAIPFVRGLLGGAYDHL